MNSYHHRFLRLFLTFVILLNSTLIGWSNNPSLYAQETNRTDPPAWVSKIVSEQTILLHGNVSGIAGASTPLLVYAVAPSGIIRQVAEVDGDGNFAFPPLPRDSYRLRLATIEGEAIPLRADSDTNILPDTPDRALQLFTEDAPIFGADSATIDQSLVALPEADPAATSDPLSLALAEERQRAAELEMQMDATQSPMQEEAIVPSKEAAQESASQSSTIFLPVISNEQGTTQTVEQMQTAPENSNAQENSVQPSAVYEVAAGNGKISGRVTDVNNGNGVANVSVYAREVSFQDFGNAVTNATGHYTISGLLNGSYSVEFDPPFNSELQGEYYNNQRSSTSANPVSVTEDNLTPNINAGLETGARITGRVTAADSGAGLGNLYVYLYRSSGASVSSTYIQSGGYYTFSGLPADGYKILFWPPHGTEYLEEYYNNKRSLEEATPITVTLNTTTTNINGVLKKGGRVTGRVTDAGNGTGIAGVDVTIYRSTGSFLTSVSTVSGGYYTFTNLPPDAYHVRFQAPFNSEYLDEYYNNKRTLDEATPITVTLGTTVTNVNAALETGGRLTGRVTGITNGEGLANASVRLYAGDNNFKSGQTDAAGYYTFTELLAGTIKVQFTPPFNTDYVEEYYNNKRSLTDATPVSISFNTTTTNISGVLDVGGRITGRITDATTGSPIQNVYLYAQRNSTDVFALASSDSAGYYTITNLLADSYVVRASPPFNSEYFNEYYNGKTEVDQADLVNVVLNTTTPAINFTLDRSGRVLGRVTNNAGQALADVRVYIRKDAQFFDDTSTYTDANGNYTFTRLSEYNYTVRFAAPLGSGYVDEYYNNQRTIAQAARISVTTNSTINNINAQLEVGGKITGLIINKAGAGLANITVRLLEGNNGFATEITTDSDSTGYYTLTGLLTGAYYVSFDPSTTDYLAEYYDNQRSIERAREVTATLGQVTPNINASLELGGKISGKVTSSDGSPLEDVVVGVYRSLDQQFTTSYGVTDAAGRYTVTGLYYGQYYLYFDARDSIHVDEYYDNAQELVLAKPVKVAIDTVVSGIDAQLAKGSSVTGRVTNEKGEGLPYVAVNGYSSVTDEFSNARVTTDNRGYYTLTPLAAGSYFIKFTPGFYDYGTDYARQYYNGKTHRRIANAVTVPANSVVPNINAVLKPDPGEIRGRVSDATGKGLADVFVYAYYNQVEAAAAGTKSDANGVYTLTHLAPGSYYLYFNSRQGGYLDESYNNQRNFSDAEPVTVVANTPTQNINATLENGGTISGQVLLADGNPASEANLTVEAKPGIGFVLERRTTADASGKYTVTGLLAGSYSVYAAPVITNTEYQGGYYNGKPNAAAADAVTVALKGVTPNINIVLQKRGAISGRVTDTAGKPLDNISVQLSTDRYNTFYSSVRTDAQGAYTITGLYAGTYYLYFATDARSNLQGEYYNNQHNAADAAGINVTSGITVTNINAVLEPGGSITGKVTAADTNSPLSNVSVYAYGRDDCGEFGFMRSTTADASGIYTMTGLAAGTYDIYASPGSHREYLYQWLDDVSVTVGTTTTDANLALQRGGRIAGRILAADSNFPLAEVRANFYRTLSNGNLTWEASDTTDSDGYYRSNALPAGSYKVYFAADAGNASSAYLDDIYNGKELLSSGDAVIVSAPNTTNLVDVKLIRGGQIAGTLIDEVTLAPLADVDIYIYGSRSATFPVEITFLRNGNYLTEGLPAGTYYVRFRTASTTNQEYIEEYYKDTASLSTASPVTVNAGAITSGINGELTIGATISGRVTLQATGEGASAVTIIADGNGAGYGSTNPDSGGYYKIYGLASDSYKVGFYGSRDERRCGYIQYSTSFYNGKSRIEDADLLTLAAPNRSNPGLQGAASEAVPSVLNNINAILSSSDVASVATPTPTITPGGPTLTPTPTITPGGPTLTPTSTPVGQKSIYLPVVSR